MQRTGERFLFSSPRVGPLSAMNVLRENDPHFSNSLLLTSELHVSIQVRAVDFSVWMTFLSRNIFCALTIYFSHYVFGLFFSRALAVCTFTKSETMRATKTVAVVGAGASGIVASKVLLKDGFDVVIFERQKELGGIWCEESSYVGLHTQQPGGTMEFSDLYDGGGRGAMLSAASKSHRVAL